MTVPTWSEVVRASEFVPGQPVTADLLNRMYANAFAVFGLDPDQATVPVFSFPPSSTVSSRLYYVGLIADSAHNGDYSTDEFIVSDISAVMERVSVLPLRGRADGYTNYAGTHITNSQFDSHGLDGSGTTSWAGQISSIDTIYSSGSPTGVRIQGQTYSNVSSPTVRPFDVTVTLTNSYQSIMSIAGTDLKAKARSDGTSVYLAFRVSNSTASFTITLGITVLITSFVNKAAP